MYARKLHTKVFLVSSNFAFFKNWNDLQLIVMVAQHQSFARAAEALGVNQVTVAKRLSDLELSIGRRLFTRRRAGAAPTALCLEILEDIRPIADAVRNVEDGLKQARTAPSAVTIGASEGLLTYTIIPALEGARRAPHPIDLARLRRDGAPPLKFTTDLKAADVSVWLAAENALPAIRGAYQVRRLGSIAFRPFVNEALISDQGFRCGSFDDLDNVPLFDMKQYSFFKSLDGWNELCARHADTRLFDTTHDLQAAFRQEAGVTLSPTYSHLYESRILPLEIAYPRMAVSLWVSAHEDNLREPQVRRVFDALGDAFESSPWFH